MSFSSDVKKELNSEKFIKKGGGSRLFLEPENAQNGGKRFTLPSDTTIISEVDLTHLDTDEKRALFREIFLLSGTVSDPAKSYHLEIVCSDERSAGFVKALLESFGTKAKFTGRKDSFVVYLKEAEDVGDALAIMGASAAYLSYENARVLSSVRGNVNRRCNCETANIGKTVGAAMKQLSDIELIEKNSGLSSLPENLREIAVLRKENPELSIEELGKLLHPPIGKSGANHRLRRISEIAVTLRQ